MDSNDCTVYPQKVTEKIAAVKPIDTCGWQKLRHEDEVVDFGEFVPKLIIRVHDYFGASALPLVLVLRQA